MTSSNPLLRSPVPHYPKRGLMRFVRKSESDVSLARAPVAVPPAHFVVGMEEDKRPLYPERLPEGLPEGIVEGTAISCTSYVARVDEVSARGEVSVTLWERPNGREGLTTLVWDKRLGDERPEAGDLLWIWTWVDVVEGKSIDKIHVEIERAELTEEDRLELGALLERLREEHE